MVGGAMLLFLFWWPIVKCSPNLETPPFVSRALLTQAVKLGAVALGGGLNGAIVGGRGSHGSHWGHRDAIVFLSREKGRKTVGASRHQWSQRTDCVSRSALSLRLSRPEWLGKVSLDQKLLGAPCSQDLVPAVCSEWTLCSSAFAGCCPPWAYL